MDNNYLFKKVLFFIILFLCINNANADQCFIASKNNHVIYSEGICNQRVTPASTFKVAISLMGYDSGILIDEKQPQWPYKDEYVDWLEVWKQPYDPAMRMKNSCVWYSQEITKKLGIRLFKKYIHKFDYGNMKVVGRNSLTNSWLSGSLLISPEEQIRFLNKLTNNKLPVSTESQAMTRKLMFIEKLNNGRELYGKTGNGYIQDHDGNVLKDRQVGWFVGFVKNGDDVITFAQLITDNSKQDTYASFRAKAELKKNIVKIIPKNSILQKNIVLHDSTHNRIIPIVIYNNTENTENKNIPVVIINHGYGVKSTEYTFMANTLAKKGYYVISIQHDLDGDPDLPRTGNLYQLRMPFWDRSVKSLQFVITKISQDKPELAKLFL